MNLYIKIAVPKNGALVKVSILGLKLPNFVEQHLIRMRTKVAFFRSIYL